MKIRNSRTRTAVVLVTALAAVVALGGIAGAAGSGAGKLNACYSKKNGAMRLVAASKKCSKSERRAAWNVKGVQGAQGIQGVQGAQGQQGPKGDTGPSNGYHDFANALTPIHDSGAIVVELTQMPAGSYAFTFTADYEDGAGGGVLDCQVYGNGGTFGVTKLETEAGRRTNVAMSGAFTTASPIDLMVICDDNNGDESMAYAKITAIQVGTLTKL